jgi:hypothetical protein
MTTFPFTVRATDDQGAFADRNFSITVRNSKVERVAVLGNSAIWSSPTGTGTWTRRDALGGSTFAYGNNTWVIIGASTNQVKISYDLINVQIIEPKDAQGNSYSFNNVDISNVIFVNGKFYFVALNQVDGKYMMLSSIDGISWDMDEIPASLLPTNIKPRTFPTWNTTSQLVNLACSGGVMTMAFWASGGNTGAAPFDAFGIRSLDYGKTWTKMTDISRSSVRSSGLFYFNGVYIALCPYSSNSNNAYQHLTSTDGLVWTNVIHNTATTGVHAFYRDSVAYFYPVKVMYNNGTLNMLYGRTNQSTTGLEWIRNYSYDAISWSQSALTFVTNAYQATTTHSRHVGTFGNGRTFFLNSTIPSVTYQSGGSYLSQSLPNPVGSYYEILTMG